jgi:two-component system, NtrC family, response regulator HydG
MQTTCPAILIVDDEESIRFTFRLLLQQAGYRGVSVEDTRQALHVLDSDSIDMVITDVILHGPTGLDLLQRIQERPSPPPVVIIAGQPDAAGKERAASLGAFDYLPKPVVKATLLRTVENALLQRRRPTI